MKINLKQQDQKSSQSEEVYIEGTDEEDDGSLMNQIIEPTSPSSHIEKRD